MAQPPEPSRVPPVDEQQPYAGTPYAGTPYAGTPYGAGLVPPEPPARTGDVVATVVLLVALAAFTTLVSIFGLFFGMASDGCFGDAACSDRVGLGVGIAMVAPWVVFVGALVLAVRRLARRYLAFWVPLVAVPVVLLVWVAGGAVAGSS